MSIRIENINLQIPQEENDNQGNALASRKPDLSLGEE
jgi:hypothetical protein